MTKLREIYQDITINVLKEWYPIKMTFNDRAGRPCTVIGYRNNKRLGPQVLIKALHQYEDGKVCEVKAAYYPDMMPDIL